MKCHHCHKHEQSSVQINKANEIKTLFVIVVSLIAMFFEIAFGFITHSMALLSDGFHMLTHVLAISISLIAYICINKIKNCKNSDSVSEKISAFAGYTSSLFLLLTGGWIIFETFGRVLNPLNISFNDALVVAIIGLIVNIICILIMEYGEKDKRDYNFKSAYLHILSDVLTSVLAIIALCVGKYFGISYLDTTMGFLGGFIVIRWSIGLMMDSSKVLLDTDKLNQD